jgi:hypothetical protein
MSSSPPNNEDKIFGATGLPQSQAALSRAPHSAAEVRVMSATVTEFSEASLVRRINRALADSGLRVRAARRSLSAEFGRYYFVYGARAFQLRVGIDELARSLGIGNPASSGESHRTC